MLCVLSLLSTPTIAFPSKHVDIVFCSGKAPNAGWFNYFEDYFRRLMWAVQFWVWQEHNGVSSFWRFLLPEFLPVIGDCPIQVDLQAIMLTAFLM